MHAHLSLQSCLTPCNPMDCSLPGSFVEILQARIGVGCVPSSRDLPDPGIESMSVMSPALAVGFLTTSATWEARWWQCKKVQLLRKTVVMILQKVKHRLTYDPAISAQAYTRKN